MLRCGTSQSATPCHHREQTTSKEDWQTEGRGSRSVCQELLVQSRSRDCEGVPCGWNIELLAVSLRPYYMAREFSHVIVLCVYIPPTVEASSVYDMIHTTTAGLQTHLAFYVTSGDFNHITLTVFSQCVDCFTRNNKTIDLLYVNVMHAYSALPLPPLARSASSHSICHGC